MKSRADLTVFVLIAVVAACLIVASLAKLKDRVETVECVNNLRMIDLLMADFASIHEGQFPRATMPNPALPVEKRLSWYVPVVAGMQHGELAASVDKQASWDAEQNGFAATFPNRFFQCPTVYPLQDSNTGWAPTSYVGIAGIGTDAALLPQSDPRAGFFGYDRQLTLKDVEGRRDTLMMVVETRRTLEAWTAGGPPTTRGLEPGADPYVGKRGQFGGLHRGGANALFADGSVRFLSNDISPTAFEGFAIMPGSKP
jgi:prepilin-type processing-associated H-X9-DG protein